MSIEAFYEDLMAVAGVSMTASVRLVSWAALALRFATSSGPNKHDVTDVTILTNPILTSCLSLHQQNNGRLRAGQMAEDSVVCIEARSDLEMDAARRLGG